MPELLVLEFRRKHVTIRDFGIESMDFKKIFLINLRYLVMNEMKLARRGDIDINKERVDELKSQMIGL
jgi:hypothetical protein